MTMTNGEIVAMLNGLADMIQSDSAKPIKYSYALIKNNEILLPLYKSFEKARDKIVNQYGSLNDRGKMVFKDGTKKEDIIKFDNEMNELLNIPNEVELHLISISDCPESIAPKDLMIVDKFMVPEDEG